MSPVRADQRRVQRIDAGRRVRHRRPSGPTGEAYDAKENDGHPLSGGASAGMPPKEGTPMKNRHDRNTLAVTAHRPKSIKVHTSAETPTIVTTYPVPPRARCASNSHACTT